MAEIDLGDPRADALLLAVGEAAESAGDDLARCGLVSLDPERQVPVGRSGDIRAFLADLAACGLGSEKLERALAKRSRDLVPVVVAPEVTGTFPMCVMRRRRTA